MIRVLALLVVPPLAAGLATAAVWALLQWASI